MGFYAVFRREALLLYIKIGRLGYVLSSTISPFIYLLAFGMGLGGRVNVAGGYLPFLTGGIISIAVIMNSFQQTATSISSSRMYYHIFQNLVLSPVSGVEVILGIVATGMLRGIFFSSLIFVMAWLCFDAANFSFALLLGLLLGSYCFAALGTIVGLLVRQPDDVPFVNNFLIMPMTFFGGTFFPLDSLPEAVRFIVGLFPIGALNRLVRSRDWTDSLNFDAFLLFALGSVFVGIAVWLYRRYSE